MRRVLLRGFRREASGADDDTVVGSLAIRILRLVRFLALRRRRPSLVRNALFASKSSTSMHFVLGRRRRASRVSFVRTTKRRRGAKPPKMSSSTRRALVSLFVLPKFFDRKPYSV